MAEWTRPAMARLLAGIELTADAGTAPEALAARFAAAVEAEPDRQREAEGQREVLLGLVGQGRRGRAGPLRLPRPRLSPGSCQPAERGRFGGDHEPGGGVRAPALPRP